MDKEFEKLFNEENENLKKDISNRLKRIEGQVKGIQGMIDKNACCGDILVQVAAIRSAINKVGSLLIENYALNCLSLGENEEDYQKLKKLIKTVNNFVK